MSHTEIPEAWVRLPANDAGPMSRLIAAHDRIGKALSQLVQQVMYESEYLSRRECELIAAITAAAQDCHF